MPLSKWQRHVAAYRRAHPGERDVFRKAAATYVRDRPTAFRGLSIGWDGLKWSKETVAEYYVQMSTEWPMWKLVKTDAVPSGKTKEALSAMPKGTKAYLLQKAREHKVAIGVLVAALLLFVAKTKAFEYFRWKEQQEQQEWLNQQAEHKLSQMTGVDERSE